jgi:hypothetical protein
MQFILTDPAGRIPGTVWLKFKKGKITEATWGVIGAKRWWMVMVSANMPPMAVKNSPFRIRVKSESLEQWKKLPKYVHYAERTLKKFLGRTKRQAATLADKLHLSASPAVKGRP